MPSLIRGIAVHMTAILVRWPGPFEQTFVPPSQGGTHEDLASIGPVVSEEMMFENAYTHTQTYIYIHTSEPYISYKLTTEPKGSGELIICLLYTFFCFNFAEFCLIMRKTCKYLTLRFLFWHLKSLTSQFWFHCNKRHLITSLQKLETDVS